MNDAAAGPIRVLHVDDDPEIGELTARFLEREDDRFTVETATSASEGLDRLDAGAVDCVVSDYDMPGRNGIEFLEAVRRDSPELPFVLFTGKGSEEVASDAISAGVTDYLQKGVGTDQYAVLANRIANAVEHVRSRRLVERSEKRLRGIVDSLPHPLFVVEEDGTYLLGNEALADFHGVDVADLEGSNVVDVLGQRRTDRFLDDLEYVLESGSSKRVPETEIADAAGETHVFEPRLVPYEFAESDTDAVLGISVDVTDRVSRERELERTRERMQLALEQTNAVVFDVDLDTGAVVRHGTYEQFFDAAPAEVPTWQDHCDEVVHPADRKAFREFHRALIDGEREGGEIEYRTNPESGDVRWIRAAVYVEDRPRQAVGISRDVTEHKERERELERTNALLSTLFDTLPVGVIAEDGSRTVVAANQQLFDLFDLPGTPADVDGADCRELSEEVSGLFEDPDEFVQRIDRLVAEREPVREELALRDGRTFARSHQPIELSDGDGHLWMYRDVTERTAYERRLEALSETTRELMAADTRAAVVETGVEAARDVVGFDANGIYLYDEADAALEPAALTVAARELVGDPPTFTSGDSVAWRVFERGDSLALDDVQSDPDVYDPDSPIESELFLPVGDVGVLMAASGTREAFDQQDVVLGEILAGNVATALDQVERTAELRARERELTRQNERLEEFASIVSHDLRNPLTVANSRLELAERECESDHLDHVASALDRMERLIDDLLTLAHQGEHVTELESVDVGDLAQRCWRNVETPSAELVTETDLAIEADRSRLEQLFENLFRNAVEHTGDDAVTVTVGDDVSGEVGEDVIDGVDDDVTDGVEDDVPDGVGDDDAPGFYVEDDGPGIPPDRHESVFEPGHSTARDGTGFGLRIVEQIADAHGWTVEVAEGSDGGARFTIRDVEPVR